jgi:lysine N6-hydroxylase
MTGTVPTGDHDVVAIGCGPFNLGLAALASTVDDIDLVVLEEQPELTWHRGMMFGDASMQVNFLADLVTLVAPWHPLSFLAYLHDMDRLYTFTVRENFFPSRREYEDYLRWAAAKLPSVRFSHRVEEVRWDAGEQRFTVDAVRGDGTRLRMRARDLVVGIGTAPYVPEALAGLPEPMLLHTSEYLYRAADVAAAGKVTVVGSGQSGAEVAVDLLGRNVAGGPAVSWLTRTSSFAPLDYTKMNLELTTPAYMQYFHSLPERVRDRLVKEQWQFYKGISTDTLEEIHELLYRRQLEHGLAEVELRFGITVESASVDAGTGGADVPSPGHRGELPAHHGPGGGRHGVPQPHAGLPRAGGGPAAAGRPGPPARPGGPLGRARRRGERAGVRGQRRDPQPRRLRAQPGHRRGAQRGDPQRGHRAGGVPAAEAERVHQFRRAGAGVVNPGPPDRCPVRRAFGTLIVPQEPDEGGR